MRAYPGDSFALTAARAVLGSAGRLLGEGCLGRILNVIGEPIDERGPVDTDRRNPIHAEAPLFVDQSTEAAILVTGIKVVDLLAPYCKVAPILSLLLLLFCFNGSKC